MCCHPVCGRVIPVVGYLLVLEYLKEEWEAEHSVLRPVSRQMLSPLLKLGLKLSILLKNIVKAGSGV